MCIGNEHKCKQWFGPLTIPTLLFLLFVLLPNSIQALTIDGAWTRTSGTNQGSESGPRLFGTLPEGAISEMAELSSTVIVEDVDGTLSIPLPIYGDGTTATIEEILFTVQFEEWSLDTYNFPPSFIVSWTFPNADALFHVATGDSHGLTVQVTIQSWAFRPDDTSATPLDFGTLKTLFE
jgi:hypothetical protein